MLHDPFYLKVHGLAPHIEILIQSMGLTRLSNFWDIITECYRIGLGPAEVREIEGVKTPTSRVLPNLIVKESNVGNIGQLAIKEEAAGKVRVFALVDI